MTRLLAWTTTGSLVESQQPSFFLPNHRTGTSGAFQTVGVHLTQKATSAVQAGAAQRKPADRQSTLRRASNLQRRRMSVRRPRWVWKSSLWQVSTRLSLSALTFAALTSCLPRHSQGQLVDSHAKSARLCGCHAEPCGPNGNSSA